MQQSFFGERKNYYLRFCDKYCLLFVTKMITPSYSFMSSFAEYRAYKTKLIAIQMTTISGASIILRILLSAIQP